MRPEVKKDTNRIAKVNSLIQHELGPILHEYLDWQPGLVTITKVDTSKDMKYCKIWISILDPNPARPVETASSSISTDVVKLKKSKQPKNVQPLDEKVMEFLAKNIYDLQGEVNHHFHTKIIPRISFHLDTSPRYVEHIDDVLRKIHQEN